MILRPLLPLLSLLASSFVLFGTGPVSAQSHKLIEMSWMKLDDALDKAQRSRYGVLFYFPPKDSEEEHVVFDTEALCDQSRSSPMVKVVGEKLAPLRARYDVPDKYPSVVLTDWHGNPLKTFVARSLRDRRLDAEQLIQEVKGVDRTVQALKEKLAGDLEKGREQFERERYSAAIKTLEEAARLKGYEECEQAAAILAEIASIGRERIERAERQAASDRDAADKELRRIARDFKGSVVEQEADAARARLEKGEKGEDGQR